MRRCHPFVWWLVAVVAMKAVTTLPVLAQEATAAPSPARILELLAGEPGQRREFTEQRFNALLSEPMVLEGYLMVTAEGSLQRIVQKPFTETATIDGNRATLERDGRVRAVDLGRRGRGAAYLRALHSLLRGDAQALREEFELAVSGDDNAWELQLNPARPDLERWLTRIRVSGSGERVTRIRMEREDGAWQDMRLK